MVGIWLDVNRQTKIDQPTGLGLHLTAVYRFLKEKPIHTYVDRKKKKKNHTHVRVHSLIRRRTCGQDANKNKQLRF